MTAESRTRQCFTQPASVTLLSFALLRFIALGDIVSLSGAYVFGSLRQYGWIGVGI